MELNFFFGLFVGLLIAFIVRKVDMNYLIKNIDSDTPVRIGNVFCFIKSEDKNQTK